MSAPWPEEIEVERQAWRRDHTFGAFVWFPDPAPTQRRRSPQWLRSEEDLDEVEWLLDGGVHPIWIEQAMKKSGVAIYRLAKRHNRERVAWAFRQYSTTGRVA